MVTVTLETSQSLLRTPTNDDGDVVFRRHTFPFVQHNSFHLLRKTRDR